MSGQLQRWAQRNISRAFASFRVASFSVSAAQRDLWRGFDSRQLHHKGPGQGSNPEPGPFYVSSSAAAREAPTDRSGRDDYAVAHRWASAVSRASSRMARPWRASASLTVHGGTTWMRLKFAKGSSPAVLQAAIVAFIAGLLEP